MNLENHRLQYLLQSLIDNTISKPELDELAELLKEADDNVVINDQMKRSWDNANLPITELNQEIYTQIVSNPRFLTVTSKKKAIISSLINLNNVKYYAAAAILICCFVGLYLFNYLYTPNKNTLISLHTRPESVVNTENEHVVLTLSNGKKVVLDQANNGLLSKDNNTIISKTKDGQIVYNLGNLTVENGGELMYNTISTPIGTTYQLILSDGTKVWLNAKSSLTFPVAFGNEERNVKLQGEGYFEVTPDKDKPFMVGAKEMKIQVLGTYFNVSAYHDDTVVKASLIEGSIKAHSPETAVLLKPGKQALLRNGSSSMDIQNFNPEEVTDWKNGYFIFRNEPIKEIIKKISRWYNIEVTYQGDSNEQAFGGKYLKSNSLTELLTSLELTGTVKFKVDGRRVTVIQ